MSKNWYLFAAVVGMVTTPVFAIRHDLFWTVVGVLCVGCNIASYLDNEKKEGE